MSEQHGSGSQVVTGEVSWWKDAEGYGKVATTLGPIEVAFAAVERMSGFRSLSPGDVVTMEVVLFADGAENAGAPGFVGWAHRAVLGTRLGSPPPGEPAAPSGTYSSSLEISFDDQGNGAGQPS